MNILICGRVATGKTSLAKLLLPILKTQGRVVTLREEDDIASKADVISPDFSLLKKTKGSNKYHFIATTQSPEYVYPSVLIEMDMIITLQGDAIGQWLYRVSCTAKT